MNKNLLILSSSTGGGHNMRANALKDWWCESGGEAIISQPLETTSKFYKFGSNFYNFIQKYYPGFHYIYYNFLELANLHRKQGSIIGARSWLKEIMSFNPRLVLSVHAHLNHGYFELLKSHLKNPMKFSIYCGELADGSGFSRHWVNPNADRFFGPFDETCEAARKRKMPSSKTFVVGPLLRKAFYKSPSKSFKVRTFRRYKILEGVPILLLGTGANGVNRHIEVLRSLKDSPSNFQVIALCGNNLQVFNKIERVRKSLNFHVVALMSIDESDMALFLHEATCFFARPGAGTTTESIVCGTPTIFDISRGVMPQEVNNLNFWRSHASDLISINDPKKLAHLWRERVPKIRIDVGSYPKALLEELNMLCSQ